MRHSLSGQIINWAGWTLRTHAPNPLNLVQSCACEFWYDGQDPATVHMVGAGVEQWDDKSGFDKHVSNAVAPQRPAYDPITGRITFNNAAQTYLQSAAFDFPLAQPNTIFLLFKIIGALDYLGYVFDAKTAFLHRIYHFNTFRMNAGIDLPAGVTNANDNIHCTEFNTVNSNYWINGILKNSGNVGANNLDGVTLGAKGDLIDNADIELCEVFGYNCSVTEAERIKCENYLYKKWGLTY